MFCFEFWIHCSFLTNSLLCHCCTIFILLDCTISKLLNHIHSTLKLWTSKDVLAVILYWHIGDIFLRYGWSSCHMKRRISWFAHCWCIMLQYFLICIGLKTFNIFVLIALTDGTLFWRASSSILSSTFFKPVIGRPRFFSSSLKLATFIFFT